MDYLSGLLNNLSSLVWGVPTLVLLVGVGVYLTIGLRMLPWRLIPKAFVTLWHSRSGSKQEGDITPFQSLMTALSATIGTGNIAGVATAIALGGPGAVFWMWITALFGMATKYAEAVLAVHYRETDDEGRRVGGPMYYIKNGLGKRWMWLAYAFAVFGMIAGLGIGNGVQSNSVADAVQQHYGIGPLVTGLLLAVITGAVILGGIKRIGKVASYLVPIMALLYVIGSLVVIAMNLPAIPEAIGLIVESAFTGTAATGGFAGAAVMAAIRFGVARGVFSNEAGLGSAPIAHAAAQTNDPVRQGTIGMLGTFIDTIVLCTMTALVIIVSGMWTQIDPSTGSAYTGAALSSTAFNHIIPGFGETVVTLGLIVFAFTTILGWSYYGERCAEFVFGIKAILPYRLLWLVMILVGATAQLDLMWLFADVANGLMALPNLIALVLLSPIVFKLTKAAYTP